MHAQTPAPKECEIELYVDRMDEGGVVRFGLATMDSRTELGRDNQSCGFGSAGMKSYANNFEAHGQKFSRGDRVCCKVCQADGQTTVEYSVHGVSQGTAFTFLAHRDADSLAMHTCMLYPSVAIKNASVQLVQKEVKIPVQQCPIDGPIAELAAQEAGSTKLPSLALETMGKTQSGEE